MATKIIIFLLLAGITYSQGLTGHYSSILKKRGVVSAGNYIPDIVRSDTSFTASAGSVTLNFTHWGSLANNQLIMLFIVNESGSGVTMWGTGDDSVSVPGWTLAYTNGSGTVGQYLGVFWKRANTVSDTGAFSVTANVAGEQIGWYLVLDSVETTGSPIDGLGTFTNQTTASNQHTIAARTTLNNNTLALGFLGIDASDSLYNTAVTYLDASSTGWVEHDRAANRVSAFTSAGFIARKKIYSAGSTGTVLIKHRYEMSNSFIIAIKGDN